jgi:dsRNA-specific ribonuclease
MRCHEASRSVLTHNVNTKAQLLHAYVGALYLEDRIPGVEEWVRTLINYQNDQEEEDHVSATIGGRQE